MPLPLFVNSSSRSSPPLSKKDMQILSNAPAQTAIPATCRGSAKKLALPRAQITLNPLPIKPRFGRLSEELGESTRTQLSNLNKLLEKTAPKPLSPQHAALSQKPSNQNGQSRGVFDGLDLTGLWPSWWNSTEDSSPRDLSDLQGLLSMSPQHSPRDNLGDRWPEYHGRDDWAGLLDPLDDNLRRELVRYGEFVQAAYRSFNSDPATSKEGGPGACHVDLPDKSYKVTKALYATSSIGLPDWVDDVAPDLGWMTQRSSKIGYVAVCEDAREIQRMGRRDIVIALRGTSTCLEWAENLRAALVPVEETQAEPEPKVECGFWSLYKTSGAHIPSLSEAIVEEIRRLMDLYKGETLSITITGHSLGAALALLAADELSTCSSHVPPIAVFSFGGPRVGNRAYANRIEERKNVKVLRVVNAQDLITRVPGMPVGEGMEDMPWAYSHVGSELRVDTRSSPFLKPNADMACCHDLEAYLHLVDGFKGSDCPFRKNAKRSLVRLVHEQGSNVKKLYTSKALRLNVERVAIGSSPFPSCLPSPS